MRRLDYQEIAFRKLVEKANDLLEISANRTIVFKAPTGSGKTVMMAEFLKNFYLSGGTALSLQLGHRESEDLDFISFSSQL